MRTLEEIADSTCYGVKSCGHVKQGACRDCVYLALHEARDAALNEVARMVDHDEDVPAAFAARVRALTLKPESASESEKKDWSHRCPECGASVCGHVVLMNRRMRQVLRLLLDAVIFDDGAHAGEVGIRSQEKLTEAAHLAAKIKGR